MHELKSKFLLNRNIHFLNHGSFGATPRSVMTRYQSWQMELENQPVEFMQTRIVSLLEEARGSLGDFLGAKKQNLVYIPNTTFGVNVIARSLKLNVGDEILATNHEYGACDNIWAFQCSSSGTTYRSAPVSIPYRAKEELAQQVFQAVSPDTKLIFISHITSATAIHFPVKEVCKWAKERGILTLVDGAHAPGQVALNLDTLGADFYTGNCHKWMLSPKGAGFLYARPEVQHLIEPLIVGWGWGEHSDISTGLKFIDNLQYLGTNDYSAYLSVPAAVDFMAENAWDDVRKSSHALLADTLQQINTLTGLQSLYPDSGSYVQMAVAELPRLSDHRAMKKRLLDQFKIEVPIIEWSGRNFIRVSVQGYNTQEDLDALVAALNELLPQYAL